MKRKGWVAVLTAMSDVRNVSGTKRVDQIQREHAETDEKHRRSKQQHHAGQTSGDHDDGKCPARFRADAPGSEGTVLLSGVSAVGLEVSQVIERIDPAIKENVE